MRFYIILIIATFLLGACKSRQPQITQTASGEVQDVIRRANAVPSAFRTVQIRFQADITDSGGTTGVSGSIRIAADSLIWFSAGKFGFEGVRGLITRDSVFYINRLKGEYYAGDYSVLQKKMNFSAGYQEVEHLLTNRFFAVDSPLSFFLYPESDTAIVLQNIDKKILDEAIATNFRGLPRKPIVERVVLRKADARIVSVTINDFAENRRAEVLYDKFGKDIFPTETRISISDSRSASDVLLKYTRIEVDKQLSFPFQIPPDYRQAD